MPCLFGCMAFIAPRLTIFLLVVFSDFIGRAYESTIWPLLGFFFLPMTTLAYAAAMNWHGEVTGASFFMVLLAALFDLGVIGGGYNKRKIVVERYHDARR